MRDLINLLETSVIPTPQELSKAIDTVAAQYIENGLAPNTYEINNGLCSDLAEEVINIFGHTFGPESKVFFTIDAANLTVDGEGEEWDVRLIKKYWPRCKPIYGLSWDDVLYEIPAHVWIVLNGRHYDAECPQGVDNFFELPLLERGMKAISLKTALRN